MTRSDRDRLLDIVAAISAVRAHAADRTTPHVSPALVEDAAKYQLVAIGEAAGELSEETRSSMPAIPWTRVRGLRNILTHRYHNVDLDIVWEIVDEHLAPLDHAIRWTLERSAQALEGPA